MKSRRSWYIVVAAVAAALLAWWWSSREVTEHARPGREQEPDGQPRARTDRKPARLERATHLDGPPLQAIPPELRYGEVGRGLALEPWRRETEIDLAKCQGEPPPNLEIDLFPVEYQFSLDAEVSNAEQTAYRLTSVRSADPDREIPAKAMPCVHSAVGKLVMLPKSPEQEPPKGFTELTRIFLY